MNTRRIYTISNFLKFSASIPTVMLFAFFKYFIALRHHMLLMTGSGMQSAHFVQKKSQMTHQMALFMGTQLEAESLA